MNDKTLGEYKRTTPNPDETTGEALARLQAELTRLLDEADAELRDEADGGVTAALIEEEAEKPDLSVDYHAMWWKAEREREKAEKERDHWKREADGANEDLAHLRAAESRPLTPTDEMVERARAAWINIGGRVYAGLTIDLHHALTAALTEPPARPEGAEEIDEHLRQANAAALGGALTPEQRRALADHLAGFGYRSPIGLAEDGAA